MLWLEVRSRNAETPIHSLFAGTMTSLRTPLLCLLVLLSGCVAQPQYFEELRAGQVQQQALLERQQQQLAGQAEQLTQMASRQTDLQAELQRKLSTLATKATTATAATRPASKPRTPTAVALGDGKLLLGRIEWSWLNAMDHPLQARIDTGSRVSSLRVTQVQQFERDGQKWVRFALVEGVEGDDEDNRAAADSSGSKKPNAKAAGKNTKPKIIETRLLKVVRVHQSNSAKSERRALVRLKMRLGALSETTDFSLSQNDSMRYPVVLGRDFLRDIAVVDVSRKFVQPKPLALPTSASAGSRLFARQY